MSVSGQVLSRTSSEKVFYIDVDTGQKVSNIRNVYLKSGTYPYSWEALAGGIDFYTKKDTDQVLYLEWNDEYGKTPSIGQNFRIDYDLVHLVKGQNIKPQ